MDYLTRLDTIMINTDIGQDFSYPMSLALEGSRVVSGSNDGTVNVWSAETGKLLHTLAGHDFEVQSVAMDGSRVVSGSSDKTVKVWNVETG